MVIISVTTPNVNERTLCCRQRDKSKSIALIVSQRQSNATRKPKKEQSIALLPQEQTIVILRFQAHCQTRKVLPPVALVFSQTTCVLLITKKTVRNQLGTKQLLTTNRSIERIKRIRRTQRWKWSSWSLEDQNS